MIDIIVIPILCLFMVYVKSNDYFKKGAKAGCLVVSGLVLAIYILVRALNG